MIVVAIIGILAAIALPAYQDYMVRAKVSEAVLAASSGRTAVAETFSQKGTMELTQASMGVQNQASKYVASVAYTGNSDATQGNIIVTTTTAARVGLGAAAGKTLTLRATGQYELLERLLGHVARARLRDLMPQVSAEFLQGLLIGLVDEARPLGIRQGAFSFEGACANFCNCCSGNTCRLRAAWRLLARSARPVFFRRFAEHSRSGECQARNTLLRVADVP